MLELNGDNSDNKIKELAHQILDLLGENNQDIDICISALEYCIEAIDYIDSQYHHMRNTYGDDFEELDFN